jgi:acetyl-CoA acetyltransferase
MGVPTGAIVGLGITEMGKVYGKSAQQLAVEAISAAAADAGLNISDIDGLITNSGIALDLGIPLAREMGMVNLRLQTEMQGYGSSAGQMVQYASMAVASGMVDTVALVYADVPLKESVGAGAAYSNQAVPSGMSGLRRASAISGPPATYSVAARRHMHKYGTTSEQLGAVAVAAREWALMNPRAQMKKPITIEDHQNSRMIAEPFRMLDCCLMSNGAVAVIVTSPERAKLLKKPPVYVHGWGQAHATYVHERGSDWGLVSPAAISGPTALKMAGITVQDVNIAELYDCFTFTTLITLEDYGFCAKGEGGEFVASGAIAPGGSLPVNTGGGQLSSYYMWGFTPLSEALIQARGEAGERQVAKNDVLMVSGNGGVLEHHSTLILSKQESL